MEFLVLGLVVAVNFIIVKIKFDRKRWEDGIFDVLTLLIVMALFKGSYAGLIVGTIASLFISLYFLVSPPTFFSGKNGFLHTFIKRAKRTEKL